MKKLNNVWFILFIIMVIIQLAIPASIVIRGERVIAEGKEFKFKTQPIDPNDPFRGKYIALRFEAEEFVIYDSVTFNHEEEVFITLSTGYSGFAEITNVSKTEPSSEYDYIKAHVRNSYIDTTESSVTTNVYIKYPFNRYYMEETKAPKAEELYREMLRDSSKVTYALVRVKSGSAVLEDVKVNDRSLRDLIE